MAKNLTLQQFKESIFDYEQHKEWTFKGELPVVIDFYADWCGPCKMLAPVMDRLSQKYQGKLDIFKVDTEAEAELSAMFGIQSIPSLLFIPKEGEPRMLAGALPEKELEKIIGEVLQVTA